MAKTFNHSQYPWKEAEQYSPYHDSKISWKEKYG